MLTGRLSLEEFLIEERKRHSQATGDLNSLILSAARASKVISKQVAAGQLSGIADNIAESGVQSAQPAALYALSRDIFIRMVQSGGRLAGMATEVSQEPLRLPDTEERGKYLLLFNPLEGAANLDINVPAGSIFSVLRAKNPGQDPSPEDFLRPGHEQVCAGYAVYGPSTMLVLTVGNGTHGFTLDPVLGEFVLTHPGLRIAADTAEFAINASNHRFWEPAVKLYVDECVAGETGPRDKDFTMRWTASVVADAHRILMRGGVFLNPRDTQHPRKKSMSRLLFEANPLAFIVEQAGGGASTGHTRILDLPPKSLQQRVGLIFGSANEVKRIADYHDEQPAEDFDAPLFGFRGLFRNA
jgi:fructose-1,6-bisphosphatase I/sedoheptulose-1,7-bisphosphatase